jgi:hypothetical protein
MGKVWGPDAVAKSQSTSIYGNIVALDESPRADGLLYVGTEFGIDDGSEHRHHVVDRRWCRGARGAVRSADGHARYFTGEFRVISRCGSGPDHR